MAVSKKKNYFFFLIITPVMLVLALSLFLLISKRTVSINYGCKVSDFSESYDPSAKIAIYHGEKINIPELALSEGKRPVLGASEAERWIEVDLSEQKLRAWEGNKLFLETPVSTGLPWWPTPQGEFYIWAKARSTKMEGGSGKYYYNLPNVPYVMFFENDKVPGWRGYGLHGTYWHNDFGRVHSHGCVNLPTSVAEKLYYWSLPALPEEKSWIITKADRSGTRIVIHE